MAIETTYTNLRQNLSTMLDRVVDDQEIVIVKRKGALRDVAMLPASELSSMLETMHLMRSPKNAARLLAAKRRADRGASGKSSNLEELKRDVGLGD